MIQTHLTVEGGEQWLSWAYGRERALRTLGTPYMTRRWDMGDGTTVTVRITPDASYIELKGSVGNYAVRPSDMTAPAIDMKAAVQDGSKQVGIVKDEPKLKSKKDCPENVGNVDWLSTDGDVQLSWDAPGWNRYPTYMLSDNESPKAYNSFYNTSTYIYHKDQKVELRRSTGEAIGVLGVAVATLGGAKYLVCAGRHENGSAGTTQFFVVPFQQIGNSKYAYMTPVGSVTGPYTPYPFYFSSDGSRCCSLATNGYIFWGTQFALLTTDFKSENGRIFVETTYNEADNIAVWESSESETSSYPPPTVTTTTVGPTYRPIETGPPQKVHEVVTTTTTSSFNYSKVTNDRVKTPIGVDFKHDSKTPVVVYAEGTRKTELSQSGENESVRIVWWSEPYWGPEPWGNLSGGSTKGASRDYRGTVAYGAIWFGGEEKVRTEITDYSVKGSGSGWSNADLGQDSVVGGDQVQDWIETARRFDEMYMDVRYNTIMWVERSHKYTNHRVNVTQMNEAWGGDVTYKLDINGRKESRTGAFGTDYYGYSVIKVMPSTGLHEHFRWILPISAKTFASRKPGEWLAGCGYTAAAKQELLDTAKSIEDGLTMIKDPQSIASSAKALRDTAGCLPQPIVIASNGADVKAHFKGGDMFHIRQVVTL